MTTTKCSTILCLLYVAFSTPNLQAGEIYGFTWSSGVASVAGEPVDPAVAPNNDDFGLGISPNEVVVTQKDYHAIGPVDLIFDVRDSGGTTEYVIYEGVQNSSGIDWTNYHMELGFGSGAGFVKSAPGDGLDFDAPSYTSTVDMAPLGGILPWPSVTVTEDDIFATGSQPFGTWSGIMTLHVDVPDGIDQFTLRQSPIAVPEPASAMIMVLGTLGLMVGRRAQRN